MVLLEADVDTWPESSENVVHRVGHVAAVIDLKHEMVVEQNNYIWFG